MQYFCNHSYIFERRFLPNFLLEHIVVMISLIRDQGSVKFLLEVFSLKNEGVIAVFPKIMCMTSRDRNCIGEARKWRHSVRILLAIILVFT